MLCSVCCYPCICQPVFYFGDFLLLGAGIEMASAMEKGFIIMAIKVSIKGTEVRHGAAKKDLYCPVKRCDAEDHKKIFTESLAADERLVEHLERSVDTDAGKSICAVKSLNDEGKKEQSIEDIMGIENDRSESCPKETEVEKLSVVKRLGKNVVVRASDYQKEISKFILSSERMNSSETDELKAVSGFSVVDNQGKIQMARIKNHKNVKNDMHFIEDGDTFVFENGCEKKIFDGIMRIECRKEMKTEIRSRNGSVKAEESDYLFDVTLIYGQKVKRCTVSLDELTEGKFLAQTSGGEISLNPGLQKKYYKSFVHYKINQGGYGEMQTYKDGGWKWIWDGNQKRLVYLTNFGVIGRPEIPLKVETDESFGLPGQVFDTSYQARSFLAMRAVMRNAAAFIIMQYFLLIGLLRGMLKAYNISPNFSLLLEGATNSGKTTLAILLYKIINRHIMENEDGDFTATKGALEELKSKHPDTVVLGDDITPKKIKEASEKLEMLVRDYGNGFSRSVSERYAKQHGGDAYYPVLNQLFVTAEIMPELSASARSRIIKVELLGDGCDFLAVHRESGQPKMISQFAYNFINFVTVHQETLMTECVRKFESIRNKCCCRIKRYDTALAIFSITADVFSAYLKSSNEIPKSDVDATIKNDMKAITSVILMNDAECAKKVQGENVIEPVAELIAEAVIGRIEKQGGITSECNPKNTVVEYGGYYIVHPKHLQELVRNYFTEAGYTYSFSPRMLGEFLQKNNLIRTSAEGGKLHRTLKFSRNNQKYGRCYYMIKDKLIKLTGENENTEYGKG